MIPEKNTKAKITNEKDGLLKAERYCAYQERSQQEVRNKLYDWGLATASVENIIVQLITSNFLNEERFANAYAQGKFKQKGWGKNKIKQGLKLKHVPNVLLKKALKAIDGDDYIKMLHRLLVKKAASLREKDPFKQQYKLRQYALGRGYENDLVSDTLKEIGF